MADWQHLAIGAAVQPIHFEVPVLGAFPDIR